MTVIHKIFNSKLSWSKTIGESVNSVPIISYTKVVFVTADDWSLYALDLDTGKQLWRFESDDDIVTQFVLSKDETMIFLSTLEGIVYGINIENEQPEGKNLK